MNKAKQLALRAVQSGRQLAIGAGTLVLSAAAMAQTAADPFDTAMSTATTNVTHYAAALVTLGGVAVIFLIGLKYVKKIPRAS